MAIFLCVVGSTRADDLGLKVPSGFKVTLWADHEMANDIYAMTLDEKGNPVVTSRGWVKRLEDTKHQGKADQVSVVGETVTGGMGLCYYNFDWMFCGDGWLSFGLPTVRKNQARFMRNQQIVPLRFTEHGGHAVRRGPDGCLYVVYGNTSDIEKVHLDSSSPIKKPEAGGILRISKDFKTVECIAQGFRNPYDFDFTPLGDIITYDSDTERDFLLPWYSPTRMYHVAHGMHHGWRLPGYVQSLARRDYYPDVVDMLWPVGRGSPTGVVCYRHYQFPRHYRGGVFALDWTFGKIFFFPLEADGSTFKTKAEVFLEPAGGNGFAPTAACVAPDGSMFVSIGGRGTRGAIYRIEYVGTDMEPRELWIEPGLFGDQVLDAPQPLDAWSRRKWESLLNHRPKRWLDEVIVDETARIARRIRAIEIRNDLFKGLDGETAEQASKAAAWQVRARVAWSLGRDLPKDCLKLLFPLARDPHPKVRVEALNTLGDLQLRRHQTQQTEDDPYFFDDLQPQLIPLIIENINHADKRVRMAACRLITELDNESWFKLRDAMRSSNLQSQLMFAISHHWPETAGFALPSESLRIALQGLESSDPKMRLMAIRLLMLLDGDWCVHNPPEVVYSAYAVQRPRPSRYDVEKKIAERLRQLYPTGNAQFDAEVSRYFAMIEDNDPETAAKVLGRITRTTAATEDVHHLIILSRLKSKRAEDQTASVVEALLGLETKLQGQQLRIKQTWGPRLGEVVLNLLKQYPGMAEAALKHPAFVNPAHVSYALAFSGESRQKAARLFLEAAKKDGDFLWTGELIELLAALPAEEYRPEFRKKWSDFGLRDAMLKYLVKMTDPADRGILLDGLDSPDRGLVLASIDALLKLPGDKTAGNLVPPLRRLRLSFVEPNEKALRGKLLALINYLAGTEFTAKEFYSDRLNLIQTYQPVFSWFEAKYPMQAKLLRGDDEDGEHWKKLLASVPWNQGNLDRGLKLYRERSCMTCHTGSSRIGPDLTGVAGRFSRDDLFTAIIYPSRDVAPAFRVNNIETQDGKNLSGIVIFESAEGIIVQTGATTTVRIDASNLASRKPSTKSLMPSGLLKDLKPEDLADLYFYLKSLK